jgi:hypothetical protein
MTPSTDTRVSAGFTPGPWRIVCRPYGSGLERHIYCGQQVPIAKLNGNPRGRRESDANARLIAAAPELYEALAIARNILIANGLPTSPKIDAALTKARAAS